MALDERTCWRAVTTRDRRFEGRFVMAVRTTGVYCRPGCPARMPLRRNVNFFTCAAAAETAGFRPCRRCRPDTLPGSPAWLGTSTTVARALRHLPRTAGLSECRQRAALPLYALASGWRLAEPDPLRVLATGLSAGARTHPATTPTPAAADSRSGHAPTARATRLAVHLHHPGPQLARQPVPPRPVLRYPPCTGGAP